MQTPVWILVVDLLLWLIIVVLHAIDFRSTALSPFELKRRADSGDEDAKRANERELVLPRLETLRRIIEAVCLVLATALTIVVFGWVLGTIIASVLSLMIGTIARVDMVMKVADKLYGGRENGLIGLASSARWLDWFRGYARAGQDVAATSKEELQHIIERSHGVLSHDEQLRFQASLSLDSRSVQDVMTPVSVVEVADVHDTLGPLVLDGLHNTGHSRFPVIDGDIHHIVGILYLRDIINLKSTKATVREAMDARVYYIHEAQSLEHALHGFLRTHHHLFVVVNDYRETVGVLTLEDVIETLLGKKIVDEFDKYEDLRAVAESNPRKNNVPKGKTDV